MTTVKQVHTKSCSSDSVKYFHFKHDTLLMIRAPNTIMCLSVGTTKINNFPFVPMKIVLVKGVPKFRHIIVMAVSDDNSTVSLFHMCCDPTTEFLFVKLRPM